MIGASAWALNPVQLDQPTIHPEHLVPVSPYGREAQVAIEKLLEKRWGEGTMIYTDSSGKAFVVSVWGKDHVEYDDDHALHNFVTLIEAKLEGGADSMRATIQQEFEIPIDVSLATAVQRAWATMLLKTRYPKNQYMDVDGSQAEFSVSIRGAGAVFGQLPSPSRGLPKEFMNLGFDLADYCKTIESERSKKREELIKRLQDFEKRAAKI